MTYRHSIIDELTMIANLRDQGVKAYQAAKLLHRGLETIYRIYRFLVAGPNTIVKMRPIAIGRLFSCPLMRQLISKLK